MNVESLVSKFWKDDFDSKTVLKALRVIDKHFYNNKLLSSLKNKGFRLGITVIHDDFQIAGMVQVKGDTIALLMNHHLFAKLFQQGEKSYQSNGLLCNSRLTCFLDILKHESVHIYLTIKHNGNPHANHGKEFQRVAKRLFGFDDHRHGLIPGLQQKHTMKEIREYLGIDKDVDVYLNDTWHHAKVRKVSSSIEACNREHCFIVEPGLVRIPQ